MVCGQGSKSCQLHPLERNGEKALFDLQIVNSWRSKKARSIAEICPTYMQREKACRLSLSSVSETKTMDVHPREPPFLVHYLPEDHGLRPWGSIRDTHSPLLFDIDVPRQNRYASCSP
jgi:hypothetical protein